MATLPQVAGLAADLFDPGRGRVGHHAPDALPARGLAGIHLAQKASMVAVSSLELAGSITRIRISRNGPSLPPGGSRVVSEVRGSKT